MTESAAELYVYYRVPVAACDQAADELTTALQALRKTYPALASRWLERVEPPKPASVPQDSTDNRDEMRTWMEIHHQPGGLDAAAVADICAMLLPWPSVRIGPRHVEVFAPLPARGAPRCA